MGMAMDTPFHTHMLLMLQDIHTHMLLMPHQLPLLAAMLRHTHTVLDIIMPLVSEKPNLSLRPSLKPGTTTTDIIWVVLPMLLMAMDTPFLMLVLMLLILTAFTATHVGSKELKKGYLPITTLGKIGTSRKKTPNTIYLCSNLTSDISFYFIENTITEPNYFST